MNHWTKNECFYTYIHARTKSVEDTSDTHIDMVLALVAVSESFGDSFAFIIAGANANRIDVTPASMVINTAQSCKDLFHILVFILRVHLRVTIDFCER